MVLHSEVESLWQSYLQAEKDRVRGEIEPTLERFIAALLELPVQEWQEWACKIAHLIADEGRDIPVRLPLFRSVILPSLLAGVQVREPGAARRLAHFHSLLWHCREALELLPEPMRSYEGLLREALELDPGDEVTRSQLIRMDADNLEYTIHELPDVLLYDSNGATAEQCEELAAFLAEFVERLKLAGQYENYQQLIAECAFHFAHYRDHLKARCPGRSYQQYLNSYLTDS